MPLEENDLVGHLARPIIPVFDWGECLELLATSLTQKNVLLENSGKPPSTSSLHNNGSGLVGFF